MEGNSQQTFNWRCTLMFALILLGVRWSIVFSILLNFDNFLSLSKEYWDLFIILFWGIGYFSTSIVTFYKKTIAFKNKPNDLSEQEKVSPIEAIYYPVALFLSTGLFGGIVWLDKNKDLSFLIAIGASVIYLLIWVCVLWWDWFIKKIKILIKCLKEKSDT